MAAPPAVRPMDLSDVIDNASVGSVHITIFTLCALCMLMDGFNVQVLGYIAPAMAQEWNVAPYLLLTPAIFASNLGVLVGQLSITMVADKIGRRPVLIAGALAFGLLTLLTAGVTTIGQLVAIRLIAGAALGSIIPNATALISEFSPKKVRVKLVTWIGIGFTAGAAFAGLVANRLIPVFGWRSVFYVGGGIPIAVALVMVTQLPESLKLLVLKSRKPEYIATWAKRLNPAALVSPQTVFVVHEERRAGVPILHLFQNDRAVATILLWIVNFLNLFNLYALATWLPTVVRAAGYPISTAVLVGTTLQIGGTIAPFLFAWLVMRRGFVPVLAVTFVIASASIALIGRPGLSLGMLYLIVFIAGACVVGSQPSVNAMSATFYPTYLRSTGLGWALGIGRAGSIVGPTITGIFVALHWNTDRIFLVLAIPALLSAIFALMLRTPMKEVHTA